MNTILSFLAVLALSTSAASAEPPRPALGTAVSYEDAADSLYQLGRQALNDDNYERAVMLLRQVVDKYPNSQKAADALYWRAWASYRLGLDRHNRSYFDGALQAIDQLQSKYPKAPSISDARDLRTRIRSAQASLGDAGAAGDIASEAKQLR